MLSMVTARELMVSNLITLSPDMEVLEALDVLLRRRISGAPVVNDDNRFLGVFSEKSCMQFVVSAFYEGLPSSSLMNFVDTDPPVIDMETDLLTIAQTFLDAACRRLPVVDHHGHLRGQISRRDVMGAIRDHLHVIQPQRVTAGLYLSAIFDSEERPLG